MTAVPLRRNRDFVLLQAGQLLSEVGTQSAAIAYPYLVLAETGSAAKAGVVAFARALSLTVFALPAGVVADRWNRRRLMIAADAVRVLAVGGLAAAIVTDRLNFWVIPLVAFVEGVGAALFAAAQAGALRAVVPARQLPGAAGAQTGRLAAVGLVGPPLGGALFGVARALPFLVDAVSYAFSTVSLLAMRGPFQEAREPDRSPLRSRLAEGFRFLWGHRFLRTCAFLFGLANFIGVGVLFAVGRRHPARRRARAGRDRPVRRRRPRAGRLGQPQPVDPGGAEPGRARPPPGVTLAARSTRRAFRVSSSLGPDRPQSTASTGPDPGRPPGGRHQYPPGHQRPSTRRRRTTRSRASAARGSRARPRRERTSRAWSTS